MKESVNRRDFLKILTNGLLGISGLLGAGGLLRFLGYTGEPVQPEIYDLGPPEDFPPGSRTLVAENRFLLVHDQQGFTAISTNCTHLGCRLVPGPEGFACPCHGSQFDPQGNVRKGPAVDALESQTLEPDESGHLILQVPGG